MSLNVAYPKPQFKSVLLHTIKRETTPKTIDNEPIEGEMIEDMINKVARL